MFSEVKMEKIKKQKGITILETLLYSALLSLLLFAIVGSTASIIRTHRRVYLNRTLESSAVFAMERMAREIRLANSVNAGLSSFGANPGILVIGGGQDDIPYTMVFDAPLGRVRITKNGVDSGDLTSDKVAVSELTFKYLDSVNSKGVKITLELQGTYGQESKTIRLEDFVVLRGSY